VKSSKRSAPGLSLKLERSRWLVGWLLLSNTVALIALATAPLPLWAQGLSGGLVIAFAIYSWRNDPARRFVHLHWFVDGGVEMTRADGAIEAFDALSGDLVLPIFIGIELRRQDKILQRLALFSDSAHADDLRMLRVRLKSTE